MPYFKISKISENKPIEFCWESLCYFLILTGSVALSMIVIAGIQGWRYGVNPVDYVVCKYRGHETDGVKRHRGGFEYSEICVEKLKAK